MKALQLTGAIQVKLPGGVVIATVMFVAPVLVILNTCDGCCIVSPTKTSPNSVLIVSLFTLKKAPLFPFADTGKERLGVNPPGLVKVMVVVHGKDGSAQVPKA